MSLADSLKQSLDLCERIEELTQDLRDEPNHNANHMASMYAGELDGLRWCEERLAPLHAALIECVAAASGISDAFDYIAEKQSRLLMQGFAEACENWNEETNDTIDFSPLKQALAKLRVELVEK